MVVLSQYDGLVFVDAYGRFKRAKYIRSETGNQINSRQYATKLESNIF